MPVSLTSVGVAQVAGVSFTENTKQTPILGVSYFEIDVAIGSTLGVSVFDYVAEDGFTNYVAEDGVTQYVSG